MSTELVKRPGNDASVEAFFAAQPSYLFQQPVWLKVLEPLGYETAYYCLEEDGRIRLAQPAAHMRLGFFHMLYCGLPYGMAAGDTSRMAELIERLPAAARREGAHRIRMSHNLYDPEVTLSTGYDVQEHVQQVLHFAGRGEEQLWNDFKGRVRRDVRLAERRGVVVEEARDAAARDALFAMYSATMVRNESFNVWSRPMIERMWELICEPGQGEMLLARHEGEPLAGIATFYSGKRCFYFLGASSGAKRSLCPNDAVIWEGIRRAVARGCDDFDFMISSRDDQPLIDFKAKWSTDSHPFRFYERDLSSLHCKAWQLAFKIARTHLGTQLLRLVKRT
ncbi:MAG: GNAT family N-acetyltransferase [Planctomycetes bacterium]|nr:GNAT family N-acetyltransferase [Planctomycetota bacterium]